MKFKIGASLLIESYHVYYRTFISIPGFYTLHVSSTPWVVATKLSLNIAKRALQDKITLHGGLLLLNQPPWEETSTNLIQLIVTQRNRDTDVKANRMPYAEIRMLPENINQLQQKLKMIRLQKKKIHSRAILCYLAGFMPLISCLCGSWIVDLIKTTLQPESYCNICQALGIFPGTSKMWAGRKILYICVWAGCAHLALKLQLNIYVTNAKQNMLHSIPMFELGKAYIKPSESVRRMCMPWEWAFFQIRE